MTEQFFWTVEYVPEIQDEVGDEFQFVGTIDQVEREAEKRHPEYELERIVFHRRGRSLKPQQTSQ